MQSSSGNKAPTRATFGLFEADLKSKEVWKSGHRVKLQSLPFKVLTILLENAGEVVTREELRIQVWGPDIVVDFEHSLSNAIKKLREALGDSADNPRFIETLSRRGFRFIAPVGFADTESRADAEPGERDPAESQTSPPSLEVELVEAATKPVISPERPASRWRGYAVPGLAFGFGLLVAAGLLQFLNSHREEPQLPHISPITKDGAIYVPNDDLLGSLSALVTDGVHLFAPSDLNGHVILSQISVATGATQAMPLPNQIREPEAEDISPDGTRLLVRSNLASSVPQPLWIVNIDGGSAFRVSNVLVQDAVWMPDGKSILFSSGNQVAVISPDDGRSTILTTVTHRAFWPRWSSDGRLLRFTVIDPVNHTSSLWELSEGQHESHRILEPPDASIRQCCGIWTADGKYFIFEQTKDGYTDLWKTNAALNSTPTRITNGPINYKAPAPGRKGGQIFFRGEDIHSRLERYDATRKEYVALPGFLASAERVVYSRDGLWVAWIDANRRLWRARQDGSDTVLLTPPSISVFLANWSPDNTRLAFMARGSAQPWQVYTVSADGGAPELLFHEDRNVGDPSFSADGKFLVFGTVAELMGEAKSPRSIAIMEWATHRVTEIPNSQGLFSPRWSPDGRFIAAITLDQRKVMLYDTKTMLWKTLAVTSASWPVWSKESDALYVHAYQAENEPILRLSVPDGKIETIADLQSFRSGPITHASFAGITPGDVILMHTQIASGNLYTADFEK